MAFLLLFLLLFQIEKGVAHATPLLTPATRPLTLPKGYGEAGFGYENESGDFAFNLDASRLRRDALLPFRSYRDQSALFVANYGIADGWELGMRVPYTWRRFNIDEQPLVDTEGTRIDFYPAENPNGLGDAIFSSAVRLSDQFALDIEWKTASGPDNFFPTRLPGSRPAQYIGSGQPDLTFLLAWQTISPLVRLKATAGYRLRMSGISNYLLNTFNPADELLFSAGSWWNLSEHGGIGAGVTYLHEAAPNSVSVLDVEVPVWVNIGPWQVRANARVPVYGKDYPELFPAQLAERRPLLGREFEVLLLYRWDS